MFTSVRINCNAACVTPGDVGNNSECSSIIMYSIILGHVGSPILGEYWYLRMAQSSTTSSSIFSCAVMARCLACIFLSASCIEITYSSDGSG